MSFEELKARLVGELVEAQAALRADYGLKPRADAKAKGDALSGDDAKKSAPGKRTSSDNS